MLTNSSQTKTYCKLLSDLVLLSHVSSFCILAGMAGSPEQSVPLSQYSTTTSSTPLGILYQQITSWMDYQFHVEPTLPLSRALVHLESTKAGSLGPLTPQYTPSPIHTNIPYINHHIYTYILYSLPQQVSAISSVSQSTLHYSPTAEHVFAFSEITEQNHHALRSCIKLVSSEDYIYFIQRSNSWSRNISIVKDFF